MNTNDSSNTPSVLITGASRGIGRGIAVHAAKNGWSVGINYLHNSVAAEETRRLCEAIAIDAAQKFVLLNADITKSENRTKLIDSMISTFGGIDALVNNAGMAPRERVDIIDATEESFREVIDTNLVCPYFLTQAVARFWLTGKVQPRCAYFTVVNISSISAETVSLNRGEYCISKAGFSMATKLWATRLAPFGISVLEIRPGIIETDMTAGAKEKYDAMIAEGLVPERRWGAPDDVGSVVAAMLSGNIPYATGSVIYVDGGLHIQKL